MPSTTRDTKYSTLSQPVLLMPTYITSFQFSPVRIWNVVTNDHSRLS